MTIALACYVGLAVVGLYFIRRSYRAERKLAVALAVIHQIDSSERDLKDSLADATTRLTETQIERDSYHQLATRLYDAFEIHTGGTDKDMVNRIRRRAAALQEARAYF